MIAKLPLVPFVIINLTRLTAGVCMEVRFKSKVTSGFALLAASRLDFASSWFSRGSRKTSGTRVKLARTPAKTPARTPVSISHEIASAHSNDYSQLLFYFRKP